MATMKPSILGTDNQFADAEEDAFFVPHNGETGMKKPLAKADTKKRPISVAEDLFADADEDPLVVPSDVQHTEEQSEVIPSRKKKKLRKKAIAFREVLLSTGNNAQHTLSVLVDKPPNATLEATFALDIHVTTNSVLPKQAQLEKMRMLNLSKPIHIYTQPLLILDLNGLLCHRIRSSKEPKLAISYRPSVDFIADTKVIPRPQLVEFLSFLDSHFCLAVWTSAKSKNAKKLIEALIPAPIANKLLFVWSQSQCKVTRDRKEVFVKEIEKVWKEFPLYNPLNSLLIDDSPEKCITHQRNALHPRSLHGQSQSPYPDFLKWVSDEDNHAAQLEFFQKLVEFWETHQAIASWGELGEVQYNPQSESLWAFLEEHATGHMGWRIGKR